MTVSEATREKERQRAQTWRENNREEHRAYSRDWYASNRARAAASMRATYLRRKAILDRFKQIKGCAICGYREHAAALNFHHREPSEKTATPSSLLRSGLHKVKAELAKCDVLCANCHAITHFNLRAEAVA